MNSSAFGFGFHLIPVLVGVLGFMGSRSVAQELEPGAYAPSPVGFNILVGGLTFNTGELAFDPASPLREVSANLAFGGAGYVRTLGLLGRSANVGLLLPYVKGDVKGYFGDEFYDVHRSGPGDPRLRLAINLLGAPAMSFKEFVTYQPKWNLGASLTVSMPLGQYDPAKLVNIGYNRWAFRPELGLSRTFGRWRFEANAGAWFFTDNPDFFGGVTRSQDPIGALQFHVIYTLAPRMWIAYNANYFYGGTTSYGAGRNEDLQDNSRMGLTFALPLNQAQSLKFSYSRGARTSVGAKFDSIAVAWQMIWGPKR